MVNLLWLTLMMLLVVDERRRMDEAYSICEPKQFIEQFLRNIQVITHNALASVQQATII